MKVLFVIDTLEVGGAEKSILEMLPFVTTTEWVVCHLYRGDYLKPQYEAKGVRVYSLNLPGKYQFGKAVKEVRRIIEKEKPDIVHSTLLRSSLVCRFLKRRMSFVHIGSFVNDSYVKDRYSRLTMTAGLKLRVFEFLDRLTAKWCDHYVSITEAIKQTNAAYLGLPLEKITVIYRGRDISRFEVGDSSPSPENYTFLNVARLIDRKGQLELIRAFHQLAQKIERVTLLLAGEGPSRKKYENEIKRLNLEGKVKLLGKRDDVPDLLKNSNCFVMPSHYEGLGGAIIEAMLSARPVIASDIPVLTENVKDGLNGVTFKVGEVEDLAAKMEWFARNQEEGAQLGIRARKFAEERFDIKKVTAAYEILYKKIL